MKPDAGDTPPRHLSAVPGPRKTAGPGSSRPEKLGTGTGPGTGTGSGGGSKPPMKRRTRYTARAAVLLLVFCALVLALAYPLQQYVSQSSQLDTERNQNAAKAVEVSKLKQQLAQWQDPAFVEIEARKRLHYVKPGEVGLRLLGPSDAAGGWTSAGAPGSNGTAWYSQLWNSITAAAASATPSQGTSATPGRPETPTPSGALPETPPSPSDH